MNLSSHFRLPELVATLLQLRFISCLFKEYTVAVLHANTIVTQILYFLFFLDIFLPQLLLQTMKQLKLHVCLTLLSHLLKSNTINYFQRVHFNS